MNIYRLIKQAFDFLFGAVLSVLFSPILLLVAILIKLDSKGPVLFKQKRIGRHKVPFEIYKFRTMRTDTPKDLPTHMFENPDAYITQLGRFLRKSSLDELPQLFNILKGEMSFIGPRPALWNQYDLIEARDKEENGLCANAMKPGITGWAQVNGRDELPIAEKSKLDLFYATHYNFLLDIKILVLTITNVLTSKGVSEGGPK